MASLPLRAVRCAFLLWLSACQLAGCGPPAPVSLPSEDDLYAYSVAVAERARSLVRQDWYLPVFHIGKVHQRFKSDNTALEFYHQALELDPGAADVLREIGYILSQRGDRMDEALEVYKRCLRANPNQKDVRARMGLVLTHQGDLDAAVAVLTEEIQRGSTDALTHYNLGHAYRLQKKHELAVKHFLVALEQSPDMREPMWGLARSLKVLGRVEEAEKYLEQFRVKKAEYDKNTDAKLEPGYDGPRQRERKLVADTWSAVYEMLMRDLKTVVRALPTVSGPEKADLENRYDKLADEGLRGLEQSLRFNENQRDTFRELVKTYDRLGNKKKALEIGRRAVEVFPTDAAFHFQVGGIYLSVAPPAKEGRGPSVEVDEGLRLITRAVELAPQHGPFHLGVASAILAHGRTRELTRTAVQHAENALDLTAKPLAENYRILSMAYFYAGDRQGAMRTLQEGAQRFPDDPQLKNAWERSQNAERGRE